MSLSSLYRWRWAGALLCMVGLAAPASAIEVLLLWDDSPTSVPAVPRPPLVTSLNARTQDLIEALETAGMNITLSRDSQADYDGDTPVVDDFDVLLHLNGNTKIEEFFDRIGPGTAAEIETYIRNGGGYVGSENNDGQIQNGASWLRNFTPIETMAGIAPNDGVQAITVQAGQTGHPLFTGLTSPFNIDATYIKSQLHTYATDPATLLATDSQGNAAVVVRELEDGRVVGFHHRSNYAAPDALSPALSDANVQRLYINAVKWADQRPPRVASIDIDGPPFSNGGGIAFIVHFTESVTGVDADDFSFNIPLALSVAGPVTVTALSGKDYRVSAAGATGSGLLALDVLDDDSIEDESVSQNALAGLSGADGSFNTGPQLFVDAIQPSVQLVSTNPDPATAETTPTLIIDFDETMKNTVFPVITVTTAGNGTIAVDPGTWTGAAQYQADLSRELTNLDAGSASLSISGAQDALGNTMTAFSGSISFTAMGLSAIISPSTQQVRELGDSITFNVSVLGATGAPQYDWKKQNGVTIVNVGPNAPALTVSNLTFGDSGTYFCVVSDGSDSAQSAGVLLTVVEALPAASVWFLLVVVLLVVAMIVRNGANNQ